MKEEVKSKLDETKVVVAETSEKLDKRQIEQVFHDFPGIPLVPLVQHKSPGVFFVFEKASLVPAYVGKTYQILNPEDHANFLRRKKMDPYSYRPDIIFEALLEVTESQTAIFTNQGRYKPFMLKLTKECLSKLNQILAYQRHLRASAV